MRDRRLERCWTGCLRRRTATAAWTGACVRPTPSCRPVRWASTQAVHGLKWSVWGKKYIKHLRDCLTQDAFFLKKKIRCCATPSNCWLCLELVSWCTLQELDQGSQPWDFDYKIIYHQNVRHPWTFIRQENKWLVPLVNLSPSFHVFALRFCRTCFLLLLFPLRRLLFLEAGWLISIIAWAEVFPQSKGAPGRRHKGTTSPQIIHPLNIPDARLILPDTHWQTDGLFPTETFPFQANNVKGPVPKAA